MERKLVAVLAADAVGYSRLVGADEDRALALFTELRVLIEQCVKEHHGRVFGGAGDSLMAEFSSPVEALRSAVDIQRKLSIANERFSDDQQMRFRIGLNLGDVVDDQGNLRGEAVNVAARLEGLADPGGIRVSESFYEHVKHLPNLAFQDLGPHKLKNIPFQVRVYAFEESKSSRPFKSTVSWKWAAVIPVVIATAIAWEYLPEYGFNKAAAPQLAVAAQPSVAVLPLDNLSGDSSQDYFSDGLTNDITTDLSKFSGLFVIASNSAFTFKKKPSKVQDIGNYLGVRYVLEGTVQKTPNRLRVNAQLIDAATGHHVWAERYDRELGEFFEVQDAIVQQIVTALAVKVNAAELKRAEQKTESLDAYDFYLRANEVMSDQNKITALGNDEARHLFEKAIELDPTFSRVYADLSYLYVREYQNGWSPDGNKSLSTAEAMAKKALAISDDFDGHWSLASVYWNKGEFEKSFIEYEIAHKLNPNNPDLAADMAEAMIYGGEPERAVQQIKDAMRHNPIIPYWYWWNLGRALYMTKQYSEAIEAISKITDPPNDVLLITAASKAQLGQLDAARSDMKEFSKNDSDWSIAKSAEYYYRDDRDRQHWLEGLRKAGLKEK